MHCNWTIKLQQGKQSKISNKITYCVINDDTGATFCNEGSASVTQIAFEQQSMNSNSNSNFINEVQILEEYKFNITNLNVERHLSLAFTVGFSYLNHAETLVRPNEIHHRGEPTQLLVPSLQHSRNIYTHSSGFTWNAGISNTPVNTSKTVIIKVQRYQNCIQCLGWIRGAGPICGAGLNEGWKCRAHL